jgi:hypothetical protein
MRGLGVILNCEKLPYPSRSRGVLPLRRVVKAFGLQILNEFCNFNRTLNRKTLTVEFDAFDFVQGFCRKITFTAMWAAYHRDILDDEQIFALAIRLSDSAEACALSPTNTAFQLGRLSFFHEVRSSAFRRIIADLQQLLMFQQFSNLPLEVPEGTTTNAHLTFPFPTKPDTSFAPRSARRW